MKISEKAKSDIVEKIKNMHDVSQNELRLKRLYESVDKNDNIISRSYQIVDALAMLAKNHIEIDFPKDDDIICYFLKGDDQKHPYGRIKYSYKIHTVEESIHEFYSMRIEKQKITYEYVFNYSSVDLSPDRKDDYEKILKVFNMYVRDFDRIEELFWTSLKNLLDEIESK